MCKLLSSLLPPIDVRIPLIPYFFVLRHHLATLHLLSLLPHTSLQRVSSELLIPIVDASSSDGDVKAILKSTSSESVPPEQRKELLKLLPHLVSSSCAAGAASSNERFVIVYLVEGRLISPTQSNVAYRSTTSMCS